MTDATSTRSPNDLAFPDHCKSETSDMVKEGEELYGGLLGWTLSAPPLVMSTSMLASSYHVWSWLQMSGRFSNRNETIEFPRNLNVGSERGI